MQYYYIEYETRGGVDVIPLLTHFEKHVFGVSVPFLQKRPRFSGEISVHFAGSGSQRRLNFRLFFFLFLLLGDLQKKVRFLKGCWNCQKRHFFDGNFREFSGISRFRKIFGRIFTPNFPEFSRRVHPAAERIPEKTGKKSRRNSAGFPGGFRGVSPTVFGQKSVENHRISFIFYCVNNSLQSVFTRFAGFPSIRRTKK